MRKIIYKDFVFKGQNDAAGNMYLREGWLHGFTNSGSAIIETMEKKVEFHAATDLEFVDSPEDEQLAEFAKAAMQGMLSNSDFSKFQSNSLASMAIATSKDTIAELKKQKP